MAQRTGLGPDLPRGTCHEIVVKDVEESSGESRFSVASAMRSSAKRSRRDSRNIAIALALLALAVIMFLVTIVKFEEQMEANGMPQIRGEIKPLNVQTSGIAALSKRDACAWESEMPVASLPPPLSTSAARKNLSRSPMQALLVCEVSC